MSDLYQEIIIEEFRHPHHFGKLADADYVLRERNASCGDEVTIYLKLDEKGKISDVAWEGSGCAISMAAMSALSQTLKSKTISELQNIHKKEIEDLLGLTDISPGRLRCLLLGAFALKKIKI